MVNTDDLHAGFACNEALLRSEIGFWREMIDSCGGTAPRDNVERMEQALALAESRLMTLFAEYRKAPRADSEQPPNVYCLDDRRR
jgi:hypothetical protein